MAMGMSWKVSSWKAIVVIGDAPCHGRDYNDAADDDFPQDSPKMDAALRLIYNRGVNLLFSAITEATTKMEWQFERLFQSFNESSNRSWPCFRSSTLPAAPR